MFLLVFVHSSITFVISHRDNWLVVMLDGSFSVLYCCRFFRLIFPFNKTVRVHAIEAADIHSQTRRPTRIVDFVGARQSGGGILEFPDVMPERFIIWISPRGRGQDNRNPSVENAWCLLIVYFDWSLILFTLVEWNAHRERTHNVLLPVPKNSLGQVSLINVIGRCLVCGQITELSARICVKFGLIHEIYPARAHTAQLMPPSIDSFIQVNTKFSDQLTPGEHR